MISMQANICGVKNISEIDTQQLKKIFGQQPKVDVTSSLGNISFENNKMIILSGTFFDITGNGKKYKVCNSTFSKEIDSHKISGDGLFEGEWDEIGEKIAALFFSQFNEGAVIYRNNEQCSLLKNKDGTIELVGYTSLIISKFSKYLSKT